jgi:hypothetical protein
MESEQTMDLPKEFFTAQSTTTLTGAAGITFVISGAIQSAFNFNPRWLSLLIAIVVAQLGIWQTKGGLEDHLFGLLNGCLIYLTAVGLSAITGRSNSSAKRDTFEGPAKTRRFFSSWW